MLTLLMWVGEWMKARDVRDEIFLVTKYTTGFQAHNKHRTIQSDFGGNGSKPLRMAVTDSLRRIQTDYIDFLYVHWWDYTTSLPELMHSLNDLVSSGKIIYLGVSDSPAWIVSMTIQHARDHGLRQLSVYQGQWSCNMRDFERDIIPMTTNQGMALAP